MTDRSLLFRPNDFHSFMNERIQQAKQMVDQVPKDQFLASTDQQLVDHVTSAVYVEPLTLHEDKKSMSDEESKLDITNDPFFGAGGGPRATVPSLKVTVTIPYTGVESLWHVTPNPHYGRFPRAEISSPDRDGVGKLILRIERGTGADISDFQRELNDLLALINEYLKLQLQNVSSLNESLTGHAQQAIKLRRQRLEQLGSIRKLLNIPMVTRPGAPTIEPIVIQRKLIKPLSSAPDLKPEWGIDDKVYDHILGVIRHAGITFEAAPATFAKLEEEELRDVMLSTLNSHYQGEAAGERFRKHGKTDVCIEVENRAAFVAECKVWRGPKECAAATDQLLSYVTWRDSKCALVFFNKDAKGFTDVQASAASALRTHPLFVSDLAGAPAGERRFRFHQKDDDKRFVTVQLFLFNLVLTPRTK